MITHDTIQKMDKELKSNLEQLMLAKHETRNERIVALFHSYTRKLIESLAEEIIGKNIRHVTATMGDKDHTGDVDTDEVINALQDDIDAVNDYKEEQRLKVKEILSNLK